jgi:hypothetical protein
VVPEVAVVVELANAGLVAAVAVVGAAAVAAASSASRFCAQEMTKQKNQIGV